MTNEATRQQAKSHAYHIHNALYDAHKSVSDAMQDVDVRSDDWNELNRYMRSIGRLMNRVYDNYNLAMTDEMEAAEEAKADQAASDHAELRNQ